MSIAGISGVGSGGGLYDFTNLTSKQAISAASNLVQQGAITGNQFASMAGDTTALSFSPSGGVHAGSGDPLNSLATANYFDIIKNNIASLEGKANGDAGLARALTNDKALLQAITAYQGQTDPYSSSGSLVSQQI